MAVYKVGVIGAGSMGGIIAHAICEKIGGEHIAVACSNAESSRRAAEKIGCKWATPAEIAANSELVILGIKPQKASEVISDFADILKKRKNDVIIASMLAGKTIAELKGLCKNDRIIRIMPNTPCGVGEGMIQVCHSDSLSYADAEKFCELIADMGKTDIIPEALMDASTAVSGCGPAFAYMFIDALADGAVKCGLPRDKALTYAAQMLKGAAALMLETGKNPGELKDAVCSPGGSTIAGVEALENGAFRAVAMRGVVAAYERTKEL